MELQKIRLTGLSKFDRLDLGENKGIIYAEADIEEGAQGEVTLFTATVTMALISTIAAFLLRKHNQQSFHEDVEIIHPDGTVERRHVRFDSQSSEAPEADIVRQIRGV